jgi:hypothetical protein
MANQNAVNKDHSTNHFPTLGTSTQQIKQMERAMDFTKFMVKKCAWLKLPAENAISLKESKTLVCAKMYGYRFELYQKTSAGYVAIKDYGADESKMYQDFEILQSMPHIPLFCSFFGADGWRVSKGHCTNGIIHSLDCNGEFRRSAHSRNWILDKTVKDFDIDYLHNGKSVKAIA